LPEYNITIDNRPYKIELVKKEREGRFEAKINDKPVQLALETGEATFPSLTLTIGEKRYQIELANIDKRTPLTVKVNNMAFTAQLHDLAKRAATQPTVSTPVRTAKSRRVISDEGAVVAPMAGKIVTVNVQKGDAVKVGDPVCILEAMKMENEITATKAGTVDEIHVAEGTPVYEGDLLVLIK
jgi:biotin carboxyl carrier protein